VNRRPLAHGTARRYAGPPGLDLLLRDVRSMIAAYVHRLAPSAAELPEPWSAQDRLQVHHLLVFSVNIAVAHAIALDGRRPCPPARHGTVDLIDELISGIRDAVNAFTDQTNLGRLDLAHPNTDEAPTRARGSNAANLAIATDAVQAADLARREALRHGASPTDIAEATGGLS
jgi:hypothetical protein